MEELANPATAKTLQSNGGRKFSQERKTEDRRPKKRRPGFHEDMFEETNYYFKKGNFRGTYTTTICILHRDGEIEISSPSSQEFFTY